jgi:hypothetical protein
MRFPTSLGGGFGDRFEHFEREFSGAVKISSKILNEIAKTN